MQPVQESSVEMMSRLARTVEQSTGRNPRRHGYKFVVGPCVARKLVRELRPLLVHRDINPPNHGDESTLLVFEGVDVVVRCKVEQGMLHLSPPFEIPAADEADIAAARDAWKRAARGEA